MLNLSNLDRKYKIKPDESEDDYEIRLSSYHFTDGLRWDEIATIASTQTARSHGESYYRKGYKTYMLGIQAARNTFDDVEQGDEDEKEIIPEPINKKIETKENICDDFAFNADAASASDKIEFYRLSRQYSRFKQFYYLVGDKISKLGPPDFLRVNNGIGDPDEYVPSEYIVTLSDLHAGSKFDGVNNSYSFDELQKRLNLLLNRLSVFVRQRGIAKINLLMLGDAVQGILRISDLKLNEKYVSDAFIFVMRLLANFINELSRFCYVDYYMVCYSNHDEPRPLGTKASELAAEDMGKILFAYLTDVLSLNDRVNIIGDTEHDYLKFKIFDFNCLAIHGHQVDDLKKISSKLDEKHREFFDYVFVGHTHSATSVINAEGKHHDIETLVTSSIVGSCPYADKLLVGSKAASMIYGFHPKYGHIETTKIILN